MDDVTVEVHLGSGRNRPGKTLKFSLQIENDGIGRFYIYASDADGRRSGTLLSLDDAGYEQLKELMSKTERTIQELRQSGRIKLLSGGYK